MLERRPPSRRNSMVSSLTIPRSSPRCVCSCHSSVPWSQRHAQRSSHPQDCKFSLHHVLTSQTQAFSKSHVKSTANNFPDVSDFGTSGEFGLVTARRQPIGHTVAASRRDQASAFAHNDVRTPFSHLLSGLYRSMRPKCRVLSHCAMPCLSGKREPLDGKVRNISGRPATD